MAISGKVGGEEQFVSELQDCAKLLIDKLQDNKFQEAFDVIRSLYEVRDRHIFNAVGRLTRALHDAIVNFNVDAYINSRTDNHSEIKDASDRLQYVIQMTQDAADRTMDRVESAAPIAARLGQDAAVLKGDWDRLQRRELSRDEFAHLYTRTGDFLAQMGEGTEQISENLQAIILEQGYQDLTGQVLKKVIGLITDVEAELVNLVRIAGQVEEITGLSQPRVLVKPVNDVAGEGPQIHAARRDDVVSGQDDVDDLLSSLGF